jgi:hypothetical protein
MWLLEAAYIVDNQPRGVGVRVFIVAAIVHGANA